jgi:hypothetical protein
MFEMTIGYRGIELTGVLFVPDTVLAWAHGQVSQSFVNTDAVKVVPVSSS